jgi:hypothetical protein
VIVDDLISCSMGVGLSYKEKYQLEGHRKERAYFGKISSLGILRACPPHVSLSPEPCPLLTLTMAHIFPNHGDQDHH